MDDYDGDELHSDPGTFSSESDASFEFDSSDSDSSEKSTIPDSARAFPFVENKTSHDESKGKCQAVLAYITRHHLSAAASEDLMSLMKLLHVDTLQDLSLFNLKTSAVPIEPVIYDICKVCSTLFPLDEDVIHCQRLGCTGKRYKGASSQHGMRQRISYFACLPLQEQLNDILSAPGVFESMEKYRNQCEKEDGITDILNGSLYQELRKPGHFLSHPSNFSLIFNTDGVPLYSSSGVSIWPVYLVINELPPKQRFLKKNMVLWGTWQGQGKPAFQSFFQVFVQDMVNLKVNGVKITLNGELQVCKGIVLCGPVDLQAKAMLVNMSPHNGEFGCLTCQEPGEAVRQGKGYARIYPFRSSKPDNRTNEEILENGLKALENKKTTKGIKGVSTLFGMEGFDIVTGLPPDYMHGVLLGVTKALLKLQVSVGNTSKPYSVRKSIKEIDERLIKIKPTDEVPRMPRKLEKHLQHLKANELQMWLLYYSVPSLLGYLDPVYLDHYALLVEGVYILLSDHIEETKLVRAEMVLTTFYHQYKSLYGKNNCTLNVHNVSHLTQYVRRLGPMWAYSCFPFEDMNGALMKLVHGTGDVCLQILRSLQTLKHLCSDNHYLGSTEYRAYRGISQ